MNERKSIVIAGSEGLLGRPICDALEKEYNIVKIDLRLGHDIANENELKEIFENTQNLYGLVNLFCINPQPGESSKTLEELDLIEIREYLEVNVVLLFSICRLFSKHCIYSSSIINFSSTYGVLSPKHFIYDKDFTKHIGYTLSKSSVLGLTKYLATYFAPRIRVNTIIPGGVENNQDSEFIKNYSRMTPLGRMMKKEEIISAVQYFLSSNSSYTTGAFLNVDGGWTSW